MCFFLEKLCLLAAISGMELDVHHIPGPINILADDLSRWDGSTLVPGNFLERDRIRISLSDLWISHDSPAVFPADYSLPWVLPTRTNVHWLALCDVSLFLFPLSHLLEIHSQLVGGMLAIEFPLIAFMGFRSIS